MRNTAGIIGMTMLLLAGPSACSGTKGLGQQPPTDGEVTAQISDSAAEMATDAFAESGSVTALVDARDDANTMPVGDASTFFPDGPFLPDAHESTFHDAGIVDQRNGGEANLVGGCTLDSFWLFPDEGFSTYCGSVGDACQFICGTRVGCVVEARQNEPQLLYCPPPKGSRG
jgi:hypothetical protein